MSNHPPTSHTAISDSPTSHSHTDPDSPDIPSEIPRLRATHTTAGYREGLLAGKSDSGATQAAFDDGFSVGAAVGLRVGWVLGCLGEAERLGGGESGRGDGADVVRLAGVELGIERLLGEVGWEGVERRHDGEAVGGNEVDKTWASRRVEDESWADELPSVKKWSGIAEKLGKEMSVDLRRVRPQEALLLG